MVLHLQLELTRNHFFVASIKHLERCQRHIVWLTPTLCKHVSQNVLTYYVYGQPQTSPVVPSKTKSRTAALRKNGCAQTRRALKIKIQIKANYTTRPNMNGTTELRAQSRPDKNETAEQRAQPAPAGLGRKKNFTRKACTACQGIIQIYPRRPEKTFKPKHFWFKAVPS